MSNAGRFAWTTNKTRRALYRAARNDRRGSMQMPEVFNRGIPMTKAIVNADRRMGQRINSRPMFFTQEEAFLYRAGLLPGPYR